MRLVCLLFLLPIIASAQNAAIWQIEPSETTADLRGIHAAGYGVAWASGTHGTVLRSEDSGFEWQQCAMPPGAEKLDFRAIWGWDTNTAVVMSSGPGAQSRLYKTIDGCAHWALLRTNADPKGFWDGIAFSDRKNGYLLGDPVDGELVLERTEDGGRSWTRIRADGLKTGARGAFAASNTSLSLSSPVLGKVAAPWIGTGGPGGALVLEGGIDCGMETAHRDPEACLKHFDFQQRQVPLAGASASQGVFSLQLLDLLDQSQRAAIAVGGDYSKPGDRTGTAAYWRSGTGTGTGSGSGSGSGTWRPAATLPGGYRSAVQCSEGTCITVGPNGSDVSIDGGIHWLPIEHASSDTPKGGEWNALSLPWAVGPHGRIGKLNPGPLQAVIPKFATR